MRLFPFLFLLTAFAPSCTRPTPAASENGSSGNMTIDQQTNLLATMSPESLNGFQWMNDPPEAVFSNNRLRITAGEGSDFFNNPEDNKITATAPLLYTEVAGDFVATALVKPDFTSVWNAAALMVHIDSTNWIKFAFENSDATGKSIVTVVTRGISDDANGAVLNDQEAVWLRLIRKGNIYAMHWSADGRKYNMARLSAMPPAGAVKIGIEAQCPAGKPATHEVLYFSLERKTVEDLRKGE